MEVRAWEEEKEFPTYEVGDPDPNPMYLDRRVYQGSSGKVYPWPVIDRVADEKILKKWTVVVLENEWLVIWILPALGGRIHRAFDKTNGYDFVYFNRVIKPALVGLAGPWISGGIEFNWPQHHRPSTYSPVEYCLRENSDGSKSVVVSETDRMYGTKGEAVFTLHPDRAVLQIDGRLYNPTPFPQTFLWWANPAVAVNDHTQSVFPPDVTAVLDHGKRDSSRFPIATGTYYKTDYSAGVDISRYANIPVPTSYMAWKSDFDFVGGYDWQKQAGLLHVADHHVAPGKKQWTWGNGEFGRAWDRNLTDQDGPYIELMTGVFTDNQPDFTWLAPHEEKVFRQNFLPYKGLGLVKNASVEAAVHLSVQRGAAHAGVYVTRRHAKLTVRITGAGREWLCEAMALDPRSSWNTVFPCSTSEGELRIEVTDAAGGILVAYQATAVDLQEVPETAKPIPAPEDLPDAEALWLAGQHLEQYRHATFDPEDFYRAGLNRYPQDYRLNSALGLLLLRRGLYGKAEQLFRAGLASLTRHNSRPADGEISFHLGTALRAQGRDAEAEASWEKAAWSGAWQEASFHELAKLHCSQGDFAKAEEKARRSLVRNRHNLRNRQLLAVLLRLTDRTAEAAALVEETLAFDPLDAGALWEAYRLGLRSLEALKTSLGNYPGNVLRLADLYRETGLFSEALACLESDPYPQNPLWTYARACHLLDLGRGDEGRQELDRGAQLNPDGVFPNRLEDLALLDRVLAWAPDAQAWQYRGNLLYDKKRHQEAAESWQQAVEGNPNLGTAWRNLALARFNKAADPAGALRALDEAVRCRPEDARILMERDQLARKLGEDPAARLRRLEGRLPLVRSRDDLSVEYSALLNTVGRSAHALEYLRSRRFHAWEGGEGKVVRQYVRALIGVGRDAARAQDNAAALAWLTQALSLPDSLGEARLPNQRESQLHYEIGCAAHRQGDSELALRSWRNAAEGDEKPAGMMFYNDAPPEQIFYQGLARRRLGQEAGARSRFHSLVDFGERHAAEPVRIDYFAVSLPELMIFDEDLDRRNRVYCRYLAGLGYWGLGEHSKALVHWNAALEEDPGHQGVTDALAWSTSGDWG